MFTYAVVEVAGRQYKVSPDQEILVNFLGDLKKITCDKVLMLVDGDKITVGKPYLKETIEFEVLSSKRGRKIRVAKYHAKANTRKVVGARTYTTTIKVASSKSQESSKKKEGK
ncbi:50S ribosomal protein L21 [Candidatus Daviesbacteria bacterium RIFCSPHIGHO2_01_FULL_44_29]|uniref:Large ribosomal subunit protein bL21 n=1 Tax=Candidatus Daviesbacteria bacterium RIFCSPHIGHO2_02_FULL_43_12 TaxID=1797776 RepID=A0A1F5KKE8_9BACT|nr:MAG: 50S ribosomal protein L21 [Candidatus Daviesbacteria bacterium RIFCSPHIGHO2_01_FULL_44_29]OGE40181.1 MAG: 50S ribosomal protein L21 [Candidatus Daviesbacteria bacterium RIFCSPHIGHO2_12_FULL_47_45]OGE41265.1 MAG: 50S ribosomal protein L21 [Candidatus Daviesbacteria bacterium RIFCSPHIGHO2_02_FULL_43_12]OGE69466.1 MAG: 50S ribosomal protein L21 [Candidatus Daviesbacteria bacterium RIFCSPLOWO2_01_FULL_43_15]